MTIDQAVTIGLAHQPTVGLANASAASAAGQTQQAKSGLMPSVSASGGYSRDWVSPSTGFAGSGGSFSESLNLRQLIFDFGHTPATVDSARDLENAARAGQAVARSNAALTIKESFLILLEDHGLTGVAQANVDAQRQHLAEAMAQFQAGTASQADVLKAQTSLAQALLALANAQNAESLARSNLAVAMGIDPRTPLQVADIAAVQASNPELNALVLQGMAARPELVQAREQVAANLADLKAANTSNDPSVVGTGSLGLSGSGFPGGTNSKGVAVSLQWDVFDSGLTSGKTKSARAAVDTARLQLYQAQQAVAQDVTQAYLNYSNARQQQISADAEVANAQESLRLADGQYRAGVGIFLNVVDAQAALTLAEADQVNARYGLAIAQAQLDHSVGIGATP
jgi:outer membrane protein